MEQLKHVIPNVIFLLISMAFSVYAVVEEDTMPSMLQECYSAHSDSGENELATQTNCLEQYLTHLFGNNSYSALDKNAMDWIDSLGRNLHIRLKRQSGRQYNPYRRSRNWGRTRNSRRGWNWRERSNNRRGSNNRGSSSNRGGSNNRRGSNNREGSNSRGGSNNRGGWNRRNCGRFGCGVDMRRERKEIRCLSDMERKDFFDAVIDLKRDRSVRPNQYDAIALLHQNDALSAGHRGPGFLPWHRYYLYLFEEALRTKRRNVVLPYWDSRLDFRMSDPTLSVLWTEIFMGNGRGVVYTGPFAEWRTPSNNTYLRRDIPGARSSLIDPIKIQNVLNKRYHRQILAPTAATEEDDIELHHDAVHRYVGGTDGHMGGLTTSPQDPVFFLHHCFIDYLWEQFRERQQQLGIDSERDYPTTNDTFHQPNRVMDNLRPAMTMIQGYSDAFTTNVYKYAPAPTCRNGCGGSYKGFLYCYRGECVSRSRKQFKDLNGFGEVQSDYITRSAPRESGIDGMQTVSTSDSPDFRAAFDAVKTRTNAGPSIIRHFHEGIIDSRMLGRRRRSLNSPKTHDNYHIKAGIQNVAKMPVTIVNEHKVDLISQGNSQNSRLFNINVETFGFTYNGRHRVHISIDNQTHFSESSALIAFEIPSNKETSAYVRVHDNSGEVCQPQCLDKNQESYKDCTGVIKVTNNLPLMYYNIDNFRNLQNDQNKPTFLRFYCKN